MTDILVLQEGMWQLPSWRTRITNYWSRNV